MKNLTEYPSIAEFQAALRQPGEHLLDPLLSRGRAATGLFGLPDGRAGQMAITWRVIVDGKAYAVRTFRAPCDERLRRLRMIEDYLRGPKPACLVPIRAISRGIRIGARCYPLVVMEWIEGETLDRFVERARSDPARLHAVTGRLRTAFCDIAAHGIAMGDVHPGNIIVQPTGRVLLIDYDAMWVPTMGGLGGSLEIGHPNYASPRRTTRESGPHIDRFSSRLVVLSLEILAHDPRLWDVLGPGNTTLDPDALLLRRQDFQSPTVSRSLGLLTSHSDAAVRRLANELRAMIAMPVDQIPPIDEPLPDHALNSNALPPWYQDAVAKRSPGQEPEPATARNGEANAWLKPMATGVPSVNPAKGTSAVAKTTW